MHFAAWIEKWGDMPRTFKARTTDITNLGSEVKDVKIPTNDCNRKVPRFHFREVVLHPALCLSAPQGGESHHCHMFPQVSMPSPKTSVFDYLTWFYCSNYNAKVLFFIDTTKNTQKNLTGNTLQFRYLTFYSFQWNSWITKVWLYLLL